MSDEVDTNVPKVLGSQLGQNCGVDRIVTKRLFVLLQPETVEPRRNVHARLPDAVVAAWVHLTANLAVRECSAQRSGTTDEISSATQSEHSAEGAYGEGVAGDRAGFWRWCGRMDRST